MRACVLSLFIVIMVVQRDTDHVVNRTGTDPVRLGLLRGSNQYWRSYCRNEISNVNVLVSYVCTIVFCTTASHRCRWRNNNVPSISLVNHKSTVPNTRHQKIPTHLHRLVRMQDSYFARHVAITIYPFHFGFVLIWCLYPYLEKESERDIKGPTQTRWQ